MDKVKEAEAATEKTWEAYVEAQADALKVTAPKLKAYLKACKAYRRACAEEASRE